MNSFIITEIATKMAKDNSINIDNIVYYVEIAEKFEEMFVLMVKWAKSEQDYQKNKYINAMNLMVSDYKDFGDKMYGKGY